MKMLRPTRVPLLVGVRAYLAYQPPDRVVQGLKRMSQPLRFRRARLFLEAMEESMAEDGDKCPTVDDRSEGWSLQSFLTSLLLQDRRSE